ncbi:MAG: ATPase [Candidatus Magnetoglobus multicellularis str. Araruama]|uniref:ATPase n=1 Tax=Candidatus Magnetoglobus multicellularis str. Araruama TaxID=890399 RepID=A0A1V1P4D6_9BACT|nr:MAG: ATPase [Candidatus Magnetoglobus multicellularis str. Araruama]
MQKKEIQYYTLDDFTVQSVIKSDPMGFCSSIKDSVAIDEVQRVPELFQAIKYCVDKDRRPGKFILTGSANIMLLPKMSEMLVGRMELIELWPFSYSEISGKKANFIEKIFSEEMPISCTMPFERDTLFKEICHGFYPELLTIKAEKRKTAWYSSYISTLLQREIKDLSRIEGLTEIPRLLSILSAQCGALLNMSQMSRNIGVSGPTLKRYISLLQAVFLLQLLPAWSGSIKKRLIKSPKVYLNDTGLLAYLSDFNPSKFSQHPDKLGALFENFILLELKKQISWSQIPINIFYYRTAGGREVDFLLEANDGRLVGIEVKSSASVSSKHFNGLRHLAEILGDRFHRGIVLYTGENHVPFSTKLHAVPVYNVLL